MRRHHLLRLVLLLSVFPNAAHAQSVIMRKAIPSFDGAIKADPSGYDQRFYHWERSDWYAPEAACSADAPETRLVACVKDFRQYPDEMCASIGEKPAVERPKGNFDACTFAWEKSGFGHWDSTCSSQASRPLYYRCRRQDGTEVDASECVRYAKNQHPETELQPVYTSCSYSWHVGEFGRWSTTCGAAAVRTRDVSCMRSSNDTVSDALCATVGPKPTASESSDNFTGCSHSWRSGPWSRPDSTCSKKAVQTRENTCVRQDGREVDASLCTSQEPPRTQEVESLGGCTFDWALGEFGPWSSTCSSRATRRRQLSCRRSDGEAAPEAACVGNAPPLVETSEIYTGCSYEWKATQWTTQPVTGCGMVPSQESRIVSCTRSDGAVVDASNCDASSRPLEMRDVQVEGACIMSWQTGAASEWSSTCSDSATRTRDVYCTRYDGTRVNEGCDPAAKPAATETQSIYTGCSAEWVTGEWGDLAPSCSDKATRTREVTCVTKLPNGTTSTQYGGCTGPAPESTMPGVNVEGCGYSWLEGPWGPSDNTCSANATQSRTVTCRKAQPDGSNIAVDASLCDQASKPPTVQTVEDYSKCFHEWRSSAWSGWSSTCSKSATRTREVWCNRGSAENRVASGLCSGPAPATSEGPTLNASDCGGVLVNGGFEKGTLDGWIPTGRPYIVNTRVHGGSYAVGFGGAGAMVSQDVATRPGVQYTISMWCYNFYSNSFSVFWNGTNIGTCDTSAPNPSWVQRSFTVTAASSSSRISVSMPRGIDLGGNDTSRLDDVIMSPVVQ